MHREDNSSYVLYIHPPKGEKLAKPIDDELTAAVQAAFEKAEPGGANYSDLKDQGTFRPGSGWRGFHITECGQMGGSRDYRLPNGLITNNLAVFYTRWYRNSIPECDMIKLRTLLPQ